jgi:hypothetical protein
MRAVNDSDFVLKWEGVLGRGQMEGKLETVASIDTNQDVFIDKLNESHSPVG